MGKVGASVRYLDTESAMGLASTLHALSAPTRLMILDRLRNSPLAVGEIATSIGMEQSAVSHQLRVLRDVGIIVGERAGKRVVYRLRDIHVTKLVDQAFSCKARLSA